MREPPRSHRKALLHVANCPSCLRSLRNAVFEQLWDESLREEIESQRGSEIFWGDYAPRVSSTRFTVTPGEML